MLADRIHGRPLFARLFGHRNHVATGLGLWPFSIGYRRAARSGPCLESAIGPTKEPAALPDVSSAGGPNLLGERGLTMPPPEQAARPGSSGE